MKFNHNELMTYPHKYDEVICGPGDLKHLHDFIFAHIDKLITHRSPIGVEEHIESDQAEGWWRSPLVPDGEAMQARGKRIPAASAA